MPRGCPAYEAGTFKNAALTSHAIISTASSSFARTAPISKWKEKHDLQRGSLTNPQRLTSKRGQIRVQHRGCWAGVLEDATRGEIRVVSGGSTYIIPGDNTTFGLVSRSDVKIAIEQESWSEAIEVHLPSAAFVLILKLSGKLEALNSSTAKSLGARLQKEKNCEGSSKVSIIRSSASPSRSRSASRKGLCPRRF